MPTAVAVIIAFVAGAVIVTLLFRMALRHMARFLSQRDPRSNSRMTRDMPGLGFVELARAVNQQLDMVQDERLAREQAQMESQRQLTSLSHDVRTPLMGAKGYLQLAFDEPERTTCTRYLEAAEPRIDTVHDLLDELYAYSQSNSPDTSYKMEDVQVLPVLANALVGSYPNFEERG